MATPRLVFRALLEAERIVQRGWVKGAYSRRRPNGTLCRDLVGALQLAARRQRIDEDELLAFVQEQLPEPYCSRLFGIEQWNDGYLENGELGYRGKEEVLTVLRQAREEVAGLAA